MYSTLTCHAGASVNGRSRIPPPDARHTLRGWGRGRAHGWGIRSERTLRLPTATVSPCPTSLVAHGTLSPFPPTTSTPGCSDANFSLPPAWSQCWAGQAGRRVKRGSQTAPPPRAPGASSARGSPSRRALVPSAALFRAPRGPRPPAAPARVTMTVRPRLATAPTRDVRHSSWQGRSGGRHSCR